MAARRVSGIKEPSSGYDKRKKGGDLSEVGGYAMPIPARAPNPVSVMLVRVQLSEAHKPTIWFG